MLRFHYPNSIIVEAQTRYSEYKDSAVSTSTNFFEVRSLLTPSIGTIAFREAVREEIATVAATADVPMCPKL